ncbi:MAG: Phosphatidylethanolamine-binding protein [Promethearchaeota archaeon]|nr:MAG: Phosphatidylethanolamine-binding protein [Candidatus Lokiarchaeota archaeon]
MKLMSDDIEEGAKINPKFTCDGDDISPHLRWSDIPERTQSFALSCIDRDSKAGTWVHWYMVNIPKNVREIPRGGPVPGDELENDFGNQEYGGPCPEKGEHRYFFTLYALDKSKIKEINKMNFEDKLSGYIIKSVELMCRYKRIKN